MIKDYFTRLRVSRYLLGFPSADQQPTRQIKPLIDTGVMPVRTLPCRFSKKSLIKEYAPRKMAESTGRFPPTPTEKMAVKAVNVIKSGAPPAAIPNTPVMNRVRLKEILITKHDV